VAIQTSGGWHRSYIRYALHLPISELFSPAIPLRTLPSPNIPSYELVVAAAGQ
jgi:hypothetical protein